MAPSSKVRRRRAHPRGSALLGGVLALACGLAAADETVTPPTGRQPMSFARAGPRAGNQDLVRRYSTPLGFARVVAAMTQAHTPLDGAPIDLGQERFLIYAPRTAPPRGYGVLVFIPPWDDARLPPGWDAVLEARGIILVTAARSGNDQGVIGRRIPLAMAGLFNVEQTWPIDRERVYIAGFSGGSRVAERVAMANPDLFRGAILNAGSDPIGERDTPLPAAESLSLAQERLRIVFVTGDQDEEAHRTDLFTQESFARWCVFGYREQTMRRAGHQPPSPADLSRALATLESAPPASPGRLEACRAKAAARVKAQLDAVRALIAGGKRAEALRLTERIDETLGGLAAPDTLALAAELEAKPPG